jgi:hypothetical protein
MRFIATGLASVLLAITLAGAGAAGPVALKPASPQPDAGALKPGLAVVYARPRDVKYLFEAETALREKAEPGPPLVGFDYPDTNKGDPALTSGQPEKIAAEIEGFIRFDQSGVWRVQFMSNDGLRVRLGGAEIYEKDGRFPCSSDGWIEVSVPEPGWYPIKALYFQRLSTSCLLMKWQPPGGAEDWTPNSAFAYAPG